MLASSVFGASGKRPQLKVRSWLTALLRLSLLQGSPGDGVFQHDIVRDYAKSRCPDLRGKHRRLVEALLGTARPAQGWATLGSAAQGTTQWYVSTYAWWHSDDDKVR